MSDDKSTDAVDRHRIPPYALEFAPEVVEEFVEACRGIVERGTLTLGEHTAAFESGMVDLTGARHAVSVTSGTAALELIFKGLGLTGAEILVPTNTNAATAAAVVNTTNVPRFYDAGLTATCDAVAAALTEDTRAVVVVHIGGHVSPEIAAISQLCRDRDIPLVEDAAHAHGSALGGRAAGAWGRAAAFSFFPTKVVTTAEGGVVTTDDDVLAAAVRRLRNQGKEGGTMVSVGGSFRLSEFSAALGAAQLRHLGGWTSAQQDHFAAYDAVLDDLPWAERPHRPDGDVISGYKFIALAQDQQTRRELAAHLAARGISLAGGVYDELLHDMRIFAPYARQGAEAYPMAEDFAGRHFCLPAWPALAEADRRRVEDALRAF